MRPILILALLLAGCAQSEYPEAKHRQVSCNDVSLSHAEINPTECWKGRTPESNGFRNFHESARHGGTGMEILIYRAVPLGRQMKPTAAMDFLEGLPLKENGFDWSEKRTVNGFEYVTFRHNGLFYGDSVSDDPASCVFFYRDEIGSFSTVKQILYGYYCSQKETVTAERAEDIISGLRISG